LKFTEKQVEQQSQTLPKLNNPTATATTTPSSLKKENQSYTKYSKTHITKPLKKPIFLKKERKIENPRK
jgi:hypothetical protein